MKLPECLRLAVATAALAALAALAGCGGESTPQTDTVSIQGRAVDGPLQGARACYDLDDDGACGSAEPASGRTAADGRFVIVVARAEAGRHRTVVDVPDWALDADTGEAVGTAFTLVAPASGRATDHEVFASPLSTLVQAHMDHAGVSRDAAEQLVRQQAGLQLSPLADFTAGDDEAHRQAARVAALLQRTALRVWADVAPAVGQPDRSGHILSAGDVHAQLQRQLLAALPAVAGAAADPALVGRAPAAVTGELRILARALHAQIGLSVAMVQAGATAAALEAPVPDPDTTGNLVALSYVDAEHWMLRAFLGSAADNVPDAQNFQRFYDVRQASAPDGLGGGAVVQSWTGFAGGIERSGDLHWNGSAWVGCALGERFLSRVRDAQGRADYDFCDQRETGVSQRRSVAIAGEDLADVVREQIRTFPGGHSGVPFAAWGPQNLQLLAGVSFPSGSALLYHSNTVTGTAPAYDVRDSNRVTVYSAAVAAGGDARVTSGLACADPAQYTTTPVTTLEDLIARNPGRPCIFFQGGSTPDFSLDPNEWWGNSTLNIGDLPDATALPPGTGNYYDGTARLRVGFAATGNGVSFYNCLRRASDGSPRNCSVIGVGSWSIQTLGDARVLSFNVQPALAHRLGYARVLVERGGQVYYGYKNPVGSVNNTLRLNLPAANAVLSQLGLPPLRPVTPPGAATGARAAALATLKGVWGGPTPDGQGGFVLRVGPDGRFMLIEAGPYNPTSQARAGTELGWLDYDPATQRVSSLIEVDSTLSNGTSHPEIEDGALSVTATAIQQVGQPNVPRLTTPETGVVGLWALESAIDLGVIHLALLTNGRFILVEPRGNDADCLGAGECPPGAEFGDWSFDAGSGTLRLFNLLYDTNGCGGVFQTCPTAVASGVVNVEKVLEVTFAAGQQSMSFVDVGPSGSTVLTLHRIRADGLTVLGIAADASVESNFPTSNYGTDDRLLAAGTAWEGQGGTGVAYLQFNTSTAAPIGAQKAYLNIWLQGCPNPNTTAQFEVYRVTSEWVANEVTWSTRPSADTAQAWASLSFPSSDSGLKRFDVTELVRAWQQGTHPNLGLVLDSRVLALGPDCYFNSSEAASNRPFISIE